MSDETKAAEVKRLAWYEYLRVLYDFMPDEPIDEAIEAVDIATCAVAKALGQFNDLPAEIRAKVE